NQPFWLHIVVVGALLVQPGCQSIPQNDPELSPTGPHGTGRSIYNRPLSPDINQGISPATTTAEAESSELLLPPTRPTWDMNANTAQAHESEQPLQPLTATAAATGSTYTVQKGDSLWAISQRTGVSVSALAAANNLSPKSGLKLGQVLTIPGKDAAQLASTASAQSSASQATDMSQETTEYTVRSGDSLSKIANRCGTTVAALKSINGLTSDTIRSGQKLVLPGKSGSSTVAKAATAAPKAIEHPVNYTVQSGDTLSGIASRYGLKSADIMAWNNIQRPVCFHAIECFRARSSKRRGSP
ncbi:MAG TPA: LysM peptidoglycan-binding domain-containing protein, partial [Opitutales bacterium]|nr:LysM peptidoglycan-binding domain-containing protein [Opitutales bacterium]